MSDNVSQCYKDEEEKARQLQLRDLVGRTDLQVKFEPGLITIKKIAPVVVSWTNIGLTLSDVWNVLVHIPLTPGERQEIVARLIKRAVIKEG